MTITVTYDNGTTEVYTNCTGYTNNGTVVSFTGSLSGATRQWEINWAKVKKLEKLESGEG